jgi:hypothetical protein
LGWDSAVSWADKGSPTFTTPFAIKKYLRFTAPITDRNLFYFIAT